MLDELKKTFLMFTLLLVSFNARALTCESVFANNFESSTTFTSIEFGNRTSKIPREVQEKATELGIEKQNIITAEDLQAIFDSIKPVTLDLVLNNGPKPLPYSKSRGAVYLPNSKGLAVVEPAHRVDHQLTRSIFDKVGKTGEIRLADDNYDIREGFEERGNINNEQLTNNAIGKISARQTTEKFTTDQIIEEFVQLLKRKSVVPLSEEEANYVTTILNAMVSSAHRSSYWPNEKPKQLIDIVMRWKHERYSNNDQNQFHLDEVKMSTTYAPIGAGSESLKVIYDHRGEVVGLEISAPKSGNITHITGTESEFPQFHRASTKSGERMVFVLFWR